MTSKFRVEFTPDVDAWLKAASETPWLRDRFKKAKKAIRMMVESGPSHQGFCTHQMKNLKGPDEKPIWNSYIENNASNAWRMYWVWADDGAIVIVSIGPHSHEPGSQPSISRKGKTARS